MDCPPNCIEKKALITDIVVKNQDLCKYIPDLPDKFSIVLKDLLSFKRVIPGRNKKQNRCSTASAQLAMLVPFRYMLWGHLSGDPLFLVHSSTAPNVEPLKNVQFCLDCSGRIMYLSL